MIQLLIIVDTPLLFSTRDRFERYGSSSGSSMNIISEVVSKSIRLFSYISLAMFVKFHYGTYCFTCFTLKRFSSNKLHRPKEFSPVWESFSIWKARMYVWKLAVAFFLISLFFNFSCRLLLTNLCYAEAIKATAFIIMDTIFVGSKE